MSDVDPIKEMAWAGYLAWEHQNGGLVGQDIAQMKRDFMSGFDEAPEGEAT